VLLGPIVATLLYTAIVLFLVSSHIEDIALIERTLYNEIMRLIFTPSNEDKSMSKFILDPEEFVILADIFSDEPYMHNRIKAAYKQLKPKGLINIGYNGNYVFYYVTRLGHTLYRQYKDIRNNDYSI
jgi:hypothetical protein